jgi:DNA modification methylase
MIYNKDARSPFLPSESVDLFLTHPPYFNARVRQYGNAEGQLQNTKDSNKFVDSIIQVISHMEKALKVNGNIFISLPTDPHLYKIIAKIIEKTDLNFGPAFFWDYSKSPHIKEARGTESNLILNLHKGNPYDNRMYSLGSYVLDVPWSIPDNLRKHRHTAFINDFFPEQICDIIINKYSKPGDVVADLLGGTGTVLVVAQKLNRKIIYNDISENQVKLAKLLINKEMEDPMDLRRSEVIDLMTDTINKMNMKMMQDMNTPYEQIMGYIEQSTPDLDRVNGILFDMLVEHGVVK